METRKGKAASMSELKEDLIQMANLKPKFEDKGIKMKKRALSYGRELEGTFWGLFIEQGYSPYGEILSEFSTLARKWEEFMKEFAKIASIVKSSSRKISLNQFIPEILAECAKRVLISFEFVKKELISLLPVAQNLESSLQLLRPTFKKAKSLVEDKMLSNSLAFVGLISSLAAFSTVFQGIKGGSLKWPDAETFMNQLYKKLQQDLAQAMVSKKIEEGVPLHHFELFCDFYEFAEQIMANVNIMIHNINHNMDFITKLLVRIIEAVKVSTVLQTGPLDWKAFVGNWKELAEGVEYYINTANEDYEECYYV